jgi:predicted amidohydrolase
MRSERGDIARNTAHHLFWIEKALKNSPDLIVFPELSLSGYEPTLVKHLAMTSEDERLNVFKTLSTTHATTIAVGLPLKVRDGVQIAVVFFQPNKVPECYAKQLLHKDEEPFFVAGNRYHCLQIGHVRVAPAICYESLQPAHLSESIDLGAKVYLASVCKSEQGISKAREYFEKASKAHGIPILMVNSVGDSDDFVSAGRSAAWNPDGLLSGELNSVDEGMLFFRYADPLRQKAP